MKISQFHSHNQKEVLSFLNKYRDSSLFLLSNFRDHGSQLTKELNSGNYYTFEQDDKIAAVISMTRRGNLLVQTDRADDYSQIILDKVLEEEIPLQAFIGPWEITRLLWDELLLRFPRIKKRYFSVEPLYQTSLSDQPSLTPSPDDNIRFLNANDFDQWDTLGRAFLQETGIDDAGNAEHRKSNFLKRCDQRTVWGLFQDSQLISMAAYNAQYESIAQLGGVYTLPEFRRKGLSKQTMQQLMSDSYNIHDLNQLILFTGESNQAARKLYENLGFQYAGDFSLLFFDSPNQKN